MRQHRKDVQYSDKHVYLCVVLSCTWRNGGGHKKKKKKKVELKVSSLLITKTRKTCYKKYALFFDWAEFDQLCHDKTSLDVMYVPYSLTARVVST